MTESGDVVVPSSSNLNRTVLRNTLFGVGAEFSLKAANFAFNILVIRTLGGEQFGQYSIVLAWTGLFSMIGDLGITQYLAREIARDRSKVNELFWDSVVLRFGLAILSAGITVSSALVLTDYSAEMIIAMAIFTSGYLFQSVMAPLNSYFIGHERVDITSVLNVIMQVLNMVLSAIVLYLHLSFVWLFVAGLVNLPINMAIQYWFLRRSGLQLPRFKVNRPLWGRLLKAGLPFGFIQLSLSFAFRVDTIFLSHYVSDLYVGWYNAAYNLTRSLLVVSGAFNTAILPTLAREHATNPQAIPPWYYRSVKIMVFLGLPIAVGGMLLADKIIPLLLGPDFAPAAVSFSIIIWDMPILMYTSFCGNLTTSVKRETGAARIYGSLGIINIVLNFLLIPPFGIIGASFATVLTDLVGAAQFYFLFRREFGAGLGLNRLIRFAISAAIMGVVVYMFHDLALYLTIGIGGMTYLLSVWLLRAFSPDEQALLFRLMRRSRQAVHLTN